MKLTNLIIWFRPTWKSKESKKTSLKKTMRNMQRVTVFNSIVDYQSKKQLLCNQTLHLGHWHHSSVGSYSSKHESQWLSSVFLMTKSSFPMKLFEKRLFIGSHFEKLQVRNVLLIKKPFNHVNLKSTFNSWRRFNIVRL